MQKCKRFAFYETGMQVGQKEYPHCLSDVSLKAGDRGFTEEERGYSLSFFL